MNIGLVSSLNGLGHTRRLMHLAFGLQQLGQQVSVFASAPQIKKLIPELNFLSQNLQFYTIQNHGIDGPVWFNSNSKITRPSSDIEKKISKSDLIISDNVFWPAFFNNSFVLFGHFNWVDYWSKSYLSLFNKNLITIYEKEIELLQNTNLNFRFKDFAYVSSRLETKSIHEIKLMRYLMDSKEKKKNIRKELRNIIWTASGTTGLNSIINKKIVKFSGVEVIQRESLYLHSCEYKPLAVIGRPGLGTIRDCLSEGVMFLPFWEGNDPELESNINCLIKLGLLPKNSTRNQSQVLVIESLLTSADFRIRWETSWEDLSQEISSICEEILDNT